MKKIMTLFLGIVSIHAAVAQNKMYGVFENKTLFSLGMVEMTSLDGKTTISPDKVLRFAPYFNMTLQAHKDFGNVFGLYAGIGVRNQGFIMKDSLDNARKHRAYGINVPVGLKIGNMEKETYFYVEGQVLWMFDYKEKTFQGKTKSKSKPSGAVEPIQYLGAAGINIKGFTIGVEYSFSDFFKSDYKVEYDRFNSNTQQYKFTKSNILNFVVAFRTNLSESKNSVPAQQKAVQQAKLYQY
jgi:hypothetical protein